MSKLETISETLFLQECVLLTVLWCSSGENTAPIFRVKETRSKNSRSRWQAERNA
jgi:hypothetical protein